MPSPRKAAAKKSSAKKKTSAAKRSRSSKASPPAGGPLIQVARKIGTTLGEVAVRAGIVKPGGSEPSGQ